MKPFPIDNKFFDFLDTLLFMTAREATFAMNRRYPGYNFRVKINRRGDAKIYNGIGQVIASIRAKRK